MLWLCLFTLVKANDLHLINSQWLKEIGNIHQTSIFDDTMPQFFTQVDNSTNWLPDLDQMEFSTLTTEIVMRYTNMSSDTILPGNTLYQLHVTGDDRFYFAAESTLKFQHSIGKCQQLSIFQQDQLDPLTFHPAEQVKIIQSESQITLQYNIDFWDQEFDLGTRFALYIPSNCDARVVEEQQHFHVGYPKFQQLKQLENVKHSMIQQPKRFEPRSIGSARVLSRRETQKLFPKLQLISKRAIYTRLEFLATGQTYILPTNVFLSFPAQPQSYSSLFIRLLISGEDCEAIKFYSEVGNSQVKQLMQTPWLNTLQTKEDMIEVGLLSRRFKYPGINRFLLYLPPQCSVQVDFIRSMRRGLI